MRSRAARGLQRVAGLTAFVLATSAAAALSVEWRSEPKPHVEVSGIGDSRLQELATLDPASPAWRAILCVIAEPKDGGSRRAEKLPPMAGTWRIAEGKLQFDPQFPLSPGVRYRAEYRAKGEPAVIGIFELPARDTTPRTRVRQVYPTTDVLPENQLKFYVEFSAPMSRGRTYEHVHVREESGRDVELPFLELDEELWDPAMTRLTLLIDPGRIKRGVKPLEDIGPVFEAGKRYTLVLESECRDAAGLPLREKFEKRFEVGPADRTPPDPRRWRVQPPAANTRAPLIVAFDEPMDQALALRLIQVEGLAGQTELAQHEREWRFVPEQLWAAGAYRISVATTIEDLAGNNIGKVFDVDLASGTQRRVAAEKVALTFEVR